VDSREDETSLLVNAIATKERLMNELSDDNKEVLITIPKKTKSNDLKRLKGILLSNPGSHAATLVFDENGGKRVRLKIKISWNERLARIISDILEGSSTKVL
jgi:hypothetical protein